MSNKKKFVMQFPIVHEPAHLQVRFTNDGDDCPRCPNGKLRKTRDGYIECDTCDYSEYDGW